MIVIFGADGLLGRSLVRACDAAAIAHVDVPHRSCDISNPAEVFRVVNDLDPFADHVINAAGAIPLHIHDSLEMVRTNALGPHAIAAMAGRVGIPVIHISTDCVFDGNAASPQGYRSAPSPRNLYGRSKLTGEVHERHVVNIRTSFVGPGAGLWDFIQDHPGPAIEGWSAALWSGSTVDAVARELVRMEPRLLGANRTERTKHRLDDGATIEHLATETAITKRMVCKLIALRICSSIPVVAAPADRSPLINRAMRPTITLAPFADALAAMEESRWSR